MKYFILVWLMSSSAFSDSVYLKADKESITGLCPSYAYKHVREFQNENWESLTLYDFDETLVTVRHDISGVLNSEHESSGLRSKFKSTVLEIDGKLVFEQTFRKANRRSRWMPSRHVKAILELEPEPKMIVTLRNGKGTEKTCNYSKRKFN